MNTSSTSTKSSYPYPNWLLEQRLEINSLLVEKINSVFRDRFFGSEIQKCTLPGRKIRSILFLQTLRNLTPTPPMDKAKDVIFSVELIHAASVLVDDMLDADQFRHGALATEALWGSSKSLLFAHLMSGVAIKNLTASVRIQNKLIDVYQNMCLGEMYDVFIPPGEWIREGYDSLTYQKTSSLFGFALFAAQHLVDLDDTELNLEVLGQQIGLLYQLSNDFHDWQPNNLKKRHQPSGAWPITFSLPLSVYLVKYGKERIDSYLTKKYLTFDEWLEFLSTIWKADVRRECEELIANTRSRCINTLALQSYPEPLRDLYTQFFDLIVTEEFWYHVYEIS